jgi:hypothetical protein
MVRYPFVHSSREFFESVSIEESFASKEVLKQAENRLMSALGKKKYDLHMEELIEFSSFFVAALVAAQDGYLTNRFGKREADLAKEFFVEEKKGIKPAVLYECFRLRIREIEDKGDYYDYTTSFQDFLMLTTKYDLNKLPKWKLVRQPVWQGDVYFSGNSMNDFFRDCSEKAIVEGVKNLRKSTFPKQLQDLKAKMLPFIPTPRLKSTKSFNYVDELLKRPVSDGRHRLVWLVLSPFLVNIKKLDDEEAVDRILTFVAVAGETRSMRRFIEYNVRRARRNGLMPPTLRTLKTEHPDLYAVLPKEVVEREDS